VVLPQAKRAQPACPQVRTNKVTLSCQSVKNPIDAAGSLTDGPQAKHSNGRLFRILTGLPRCINKQYSLGLVTGNKKLQQPCKGPLQPFFRNKKSQNPYLQAPVVLPHSSSSPDLRIRSTHQPSQLSPMTDFRQQWVPPRLQWRYRSGFSPDSLFSHNGCCRHRRHLKGIFTC